MTRTLKFIRYGSSAPATATNIMAGRYRALSLYKSILRAHDKFLPRSMRQMGDAYVKAEVRFPCVVVVSWVARPAVCLLVATECSLRNLSTLSFVARVRACSPILVIFEDMSHRCFLRHVAD